MEISVVLPSDSERYPEKQLSESHPFSVFNSVTSRNRPLRAIVAMARGGAIGRNGDMPWHLPEDLAHFKAATMGRTVIMGRRTWDSLPRRPLPGRRNIIITNNPSFVAGGAEIFHSPADALAACDLSEAPIVIGGASLYKAMLPLCSEIIITEIDLDVPDADTFFPIPDPAEWMRSEPSEWMISKSGLRYRFLTMTRK